MTTVFLDINTSLIKSISSKYIFYFFFFPSDDNFHLSSEQFLSQSLLTVFLLATIFLSSGLEDPVWQISSSSSPLQYDVIKKIDRQLLFLMYLNGPHLLFLITFCCFVDGRGGGGRFWFILFPPHRNKNVFTFHLCTFQHLKNVTNLLCWFIFWCSLVYLALWYSMLLRSDSLGNYSFWGWLRILKMLYLLIMLSWNSKILINLLHTLAEMLPLLTISWWYYYEASESEIKTVGLLFFVDNECLKNGT